MEDEHSVSMYASSKDAEIARLKAENERLRLLESLLFDGAAVYAYLPSDNNTRQRTSHQSISDTLDAMNRAWKALRGESD
jgi:hypothetical protein